MYSDPFLYLFKETMPEISQPKVCVHLFPHNSSFLFRLSV